MPHNWGLKILLHPIINATRKYLLVKVECDFFSAAGMNVEAISEERASRSLYRIKLLSKIREEVRF